MSTRLYAVLKECVLTPVRSATGIDKMPCQLGRGLSVVRAQRVGGLAWLLNLVGKTDISADKVRQTRRTE